MQTIAADPRITFTWSCGPKGCCIVVLFSFIHQSFKSIYSTLVIIPTKWISTSDLISLLFQRNEFPYLIQPSFQSNEFPHLIYSSYYSNQINFHIWFTLSTIPTKWIFTSDLLFYYSNQMNFHIWFLSFYYSNAMNFQIWSYLFIISIKWISPSDLILLLFQPNEFTHLISQ